VGSSAVLASILRAHDEHDHDDDDDGDDDDEYEYEWFLFCFYEVKPYSTRFFPTDIIALD